MGFIRTVLGDISPEEIQRTMIHEHLIFDLSHVRNETDSILADNTDLEEELRQVKEFGGNTIVEVTNRGMGRNADGLAEISRKMGIHVVCATGFYKESVYPEEAHVKSREEIAELFTTEVTKGIGDSEVKAGIISEIGSSLSEITAAENKVFRAACDAHKLSKAPISTHCEMGTEGTEQLRIFDEEQVDLSHVSFGHQDLNRNVEEQLLLLRSGAFMQFDTIGKNQYRSHQERLDNLLVLLDKGFEDQLMLSVDMTRKSYFRKNGGPGYIYLFDTFLPDLQKAGASSAVIEKLMVKNPRRFLAFAE
ncbi:phosphotriesterase family protein [Alicyclobacillus dauci]|uniref:Phosphotriesterase-related protein n=1 Tax=Alicyclobacillus dauci TaxID=1475485 RepID=A0ABY6Z081_9BACL|nr:phosphotriesterase-related protein [Alicyclobacillus dauci]WAH36160.1 phosphotriesterase-related protein [Alicyclobacillus dauci]